MIFCDMRLSELVHEFGYLKLYKVSTMSLYGRSSIQGTVTP